MPLVVLFSRFAKSFEQKEFVTGRNVSEFKVEMHKSAQLILLARLSFLTKLLTHVSFILIRMVQPFKSSVRKAALLDAASPCFLVVVLALVRHIKELVRRSSIIKWLMRVHAMIPVVVFRLVRTKCCFISVDVKYDRVNCL